MKNSKIRIIKTSVGSVGKVTLIRELQKNGVFVIGTDMNPMSSGLYISDKKYVVGIDPNMSDSPSADYFGIAIMEVDEEKDDGEEEDENGDAEVYPLDRRQRFIIDILEDDLGCEDGRNDCSYCLEGLCQSETKLGVFGRTAGGDERIGCCLECGKSATDDEHAQAESNEANWVSKALQVYERW